MSVTVAVHIVVCSTMILVSVQEITVLVKRTFTVTVVAPWLVPWVVSAWYVAVTVKVPDVAGVILAEHVAVVPVPARLQGPIEVTVTPEVSRVTVPDGVVGLVAVSDTVAVHVVL